MFRISATVLACLSLCLMLASSACSDAAKGDGGGDIAADFHFTDTTPDTLPEVGPDAAPPDVQPDQPVTPKNAALTFVQAFGDDQVSCQGTNTCSVWLSYSEKRTLEVKYTEDGVAVPNRSVAFKIEDDPEDVGKISTLQTYTAEDGVAQIQAEPKKAQIGGFVVKVSVADESVPPLYFDVTITPKGQVPLTVYAEYNGQRPVTKYTVRLFRQIGAVPDCADIEDLYDNGTASQQSPITNLSQSAKFPEFMGLEEDGTQLFTVLVFSVNDAGAVLAWGCDDVNANVTWGLPTSVTVELFDRPPEYRGSYEVTSLFDFVSALPESVQPYVYAVLDFFESPTGSVLVLACQLGGDVSVLEELCGFIFSDPDNPNLDGLSTTGALVADILNAIINGLAKDTIWGDILNTGDDIGDMLTAFEIKATLTFEEEPDANGDWTEDQTEENWHTVVVKWSLNQNCNPVTDEGCGLTNFSLNAIQTEAVLGSFSAHVADFWDLTIDKHSLNLNYGALLNYIIEKQLLPMLAGDGSDGLPVVDSYEEFLASVLAGKECLSATFEMTCCEKFAKEVIDGGATSIAGIIEGACDSLITAGASYLRDQLMGLTTSSGDAFQIGTSAPCKFYDENNDMVVDAIGSKANACLWEVDIEIFGATTTINADFWGYKAD